MAESMADFEDEIDASLKRFREGDIVNGTVISVEEDEVLVDLNTFSQGIIYPDEYSDDPSYHVMDEIRTGERITVMVLDEDDGSGHVLLSLKEAVIDASWDKLKNAVAEHEVFDVKILQSVNAGVVAYLYGIRGFIPASQLALEFIEDTDDYVGRTLKVVVITADRERNKLILSAKEVEKELAALAHDKKINALQKGFVTKGEITRIEPYGVFVDIGDGLTGLVHISEITNKFLKSPKEVVKYGDVVKVKVLSVEDGKIRLSMKQADDDISPEITDASGEAPSLEYHDEDTDSTGGTLAGLLAGIKLE